MIPKTTQVREHVAAGRWHEALQIAATFRMLSPEHRKALRSAQEAYNRPEFQIQLGKDVEQLKREGQDVLIALYGETA